MSYPSDEPFILAKWGRDVNKACAFGVRFLLMLAPLSGAMASVGDIDPAFGQAGRLTYLAGFGALLALPGGRLQLVALKDGQVQVLRFEANGQPASDFGSEGLRVSPFDSRPGLALRGIAARDGSSYAVLQVELGSVNVQVSGTNTTYNSNEARILKLTPAGAPDPLFATDGVLSFAAGLMPGANLSRVHDAVLASDGGLFVSVGYYVDFYDDCLGHSVFKLRANGTLDAAFGNAGEYRGTLIPCGEDAEGPLLAMPDGGVLVGPPARVRLDAAGRAISSPATWLQVFESSALKSIARSGTQILAAQIPDPSARQVIVSRWRDDLSPLGESMIQLDALVPALPAGSSLLALQLYGSMQGGTLLWLGVATPQQHRDSPWPGYATFLLRLGAAGTVDLDFGTSGVVPGLNASGFIVQDDGGVLVDRYEHSIRLSASPIGGAGALDSSLPCGSSQSVLESDGNLRVTVLRHLGSTGAVSVRYRLQALDAIPGLDYTDVTGLLAWADGESGGKSFQIPIILDDILEPSDERFRVLLESVSGGSVLGCAVSEVRIISRGGSVATGSSGPVNQPSGNEPNGSAAAGGGGKVDRLLLLQLFALVALACRQRYSRSFSR